MTDTIIDLHKECVQIGVDVEQFWDLDFYDIRILFESYEKSKLLDMKEQASMCYRNAMLTASFMSTMLGNKKVPSLFEAFPELFSKEAEDEQWKQQQAQFLAYAEQWNKQIDEEGE